jgi:hypothetical protein
MAGSANVGAVTCSRFVLAAAFAFVPFASTGAAQEPAPPAKPPLLELARIECDGPAEWRRKFAPTNFGVMLASEAGAALWQPRLAPFEAMLQRVFGEGIDGLGTAAARRRWLDYAGRIELVLWGKEPGKERTSLRPCSVVRLHGDERGDLDAMTADLRTLLRATADHPWRDAKAGDVTWQVVELHGNHVSAPRRTGDVIELFVGHVTDFASAAELAKALAPQRGADSCLRVVIQGRTIAEHIMAASPDDVDVWRRFGLDALRTVEFSVGTAGPHVQLEVAAELVGEERGWFGALFPAARPVPPMLHLVPQDGTPWKLGHFDWSALWRTWPEREFEVGKDPHADFLAHLHTDYLLLGMPGWSAEESFVFDSCLVWRTRDDAKLAAGFEAVHPLRWLDAKRASSEPHDGITITEYTTLVAPLHVAIGHGLWVMAFGKGGRERVVEVLERAKQKPMTEPSAAWQPFSVHAPKGRNGLGEADVRGLLKRQVPLLLTLFAFVPSDFLSLIPYADIEAITVQLAELLDRFELRRLRTITGYHDGRWSFRAFW